MIEIYAKSVSIKKVEKEEGKLRFFAEIKCNVKILKRECARFMVD